MGFMVFLECSGGPETRPWQGQLLWVNFLVTKGHVKPQEMWCLAPGRAVVSKSLSHLSPLQSLGSSHQCWDSLSLLCRLQPGLLPHLFFVELLEETS